MSSKIQLRRGTAAQWTAANPILAVGEVGLETDTRYFKVGDGSTAWSSLSYYYSDVVAATPANTGNTIAKRSSDGSINFQNVNLGASPTNVSHATRKDYVDNQDAAFRREQHNSQSGTTYTLALTDEGQVIYMTNAAAQTLTVPLNSAVAFPIGAWVDVIRAGTGTVTVVPASGATVTSAGSSLSLRGQYSKGRLLKVATDGWVFYGDLVTANDTLVSNATNVNTANTLVKRDAAGRAQFVDPSASADAATKNYVDTKTYPSTAISDSTTVGRSVLTAADAATARTAIGAGTSSLVIGTTSTTAKAGDYQPTSANITDATSVATASVVIKRDAAGRASVADPSASTDIATKNYADTQDVAMRRPSLNTQTVSYTLALTDERKLVQMNSASATTVTVPPNSSVAFSIGTIIDVQMLGAGNVTIAAGAGVTLDNPSPSLTITRQYSIVRLQKIATDTWTALHLGVSSATTASTANTFMLRDASGRASVADPSASTDIATKNYVDTRVPKISVGTVAPASPATNDVWIDTN